MLGQKLRCTIWLAFAALLVAGTGPGQNVHGAVGAIIQTKLSTRIMSETVCGPDVFRPDRLPNPIL